MRPFRDRVLAAVRRIPAGRVATYGDVALMAGAAGAARAVGTVMRKCGDGVTPCHRVVGAGGAIGGYGGNLQMKRDLLRREGVHVGSTRIHNFTAVRWAGQPSAPAEAGPHRRPAHRSLPRARRTAAR